MRPARRKDVEDFRAGRLKFLWLEYLREDLAGDDNRGKVFPHAWELKKPLAYLRKSKKLTKEASRATHAALRELGWLSGN